MVVPRPVDGEVILRRPESQKQVLHSFLGIALPFFLHPRGARTEQDKENSCFQFWTSPKSACRKLQGPPGRILKGVLKVLTLAEAGPPWHSLVPWS